VVLLVSGVLVKSYRINLRYPAALSRRSAKSWLAVVELIYDTLMCAGSGAGMARVVITAVATFGPAGRPSLCQESWGRAWEGMVASSPKSD